MAEAIVVTGGSKDIAEGDLNISQKLSSVLLNEFNYLPFGGIPKLGFINGSLKSPESSSLEYETWLSKDQHVLSWILNSMERDLAEIFSYSESSLDLWNDVRDMYGNQNNSARNFQIHREIANIHQDGKPFVSLLESVKSLWNELETYRPPTVDAAILRKRTDEDHRNGQGAIQGGAINKEKDQSAALLSHFACFLADEKSDTNQGIQIPFLTALEINNLHYVWVIDSVATYHMSNKLTHVYDFRSFSTPSLVSVANGKSAPLLSVHKLTSSLNCEVIFTPYKVTKGFQDVSSPITEQYLWQRRLLHPSNNVLSKINRVLPKETVDCDICHFSKSSRLPFNSSLSRTTQPFEIVHSDVWGHFSSSLDGFKYFVTFIDDFSSVTWVYLLKSKGEVFECFKDFHILPSRVLDFKCPLEVLQDKAPNLSHLKVFGCTCFVHVSTTHRDKLDPRAVKCIFLRYSQTQKGYKCYDFLSKKLYVTGDVYFAEQIPYFVAPSQGKKLPELFPLPSIDYGHQSIQDLHPT
ncbi:uncharacterized protein [Primulina eburnea]|uniref:uncharacterized protein n=1 Tax=Primulina eburnea TaxID=1245227 RepID=UPI003C6BDF14